MNSDDIVKNLVESIKDEQKAIYDYANRAESAKINGDSAVSKIYSHVISEEIEHAKEFTERLKEKRGICHLTRPLNGAIYILTMVKDENPEQYEALDSLINDLDMIQDYCGQARANLQGLADNYNFTVADLQKWGILEKIEGLSARDADAVFQETMQGIESTKKTPNFFEDLKKYPEFIQHEVLNVSPEELKEQLKTKRINEAEYDMIKNLKLKMFEFIIPVEEEDNG